jgi:hypothetical protein
MRSGETCEINVTSVCTARRATRHGLARRSVLARLQLQGDYAFCPVEFSNGRLGASHAATASLGLAQMLTNIRHAAFTALPIFIISFA